MSVADTKGKTLPARAYTSPEPRHASPSSRGGQRMA